MQDRRKFKPSGASAQTQKNPQLRGFEVVGQDGETSNQLFEVLEEWNTVLEQHADALEGPAP